jgi:hypothetical protein
MEKIQLLRQIAGTFFAPKASNLPRQQNTLFVANLCGRRGRNTAGFLAT